MNNHLDLLRNEHVRLQGKYAELQRRYDMLLASRSLTEKGDYPIDSDSGFVKRLVDCVVQLYNKDVYSDITINIDGHQLRAHRFVLSARTDFWGDLSGIDRIDLDGRFFKQLFLIIYFRIQLFNRSNIS